MKTYKCKGFRNTRQESEYAAAKHFAKRIARGRKFHLLSGGAHMDGEYKVRYESDKVFSGYIEEIFYVTDLEGRSNNMYQPYDFILL